VSACPDGRCDGSGFLFDEVRRRARPCSCRPARLARRRAAAIAGRVPKAFREVSFEREPVLSIERLNPHVVRAVRAYTRAIDENVAAGRGIWFAGEVGTGKTTLAMLVSKHAMEADHTVAIYSLPRLLAMLRETFRDDSPFSLSELVERLCSVDLLHIDDVGAEQSSPWVLEQLYTVVNSRYEDRRSVVLTTNLIERDPKGGAADRAPGVPTTATESIGDGAPDARLREQIGDRTVSRLYEMCGTPLPMFGHDHRLDAEWRLPEPAAAPRAPDPFDDTAWEEDAARYGQPRVRRGGTLD
jgi:DNA replication protein DnaC